MGVVQWAMAVLVRVFDDWEHIQMSTTKASNTTSARGWDQSKNAHVRVGARQIASGVRKRETNRGEGRKTTEIS